MARLRCLGHHHGRNCIWLSPALQGKLPPTVVCLPPFGTQPSLLAPAYLQRHYTQWVPGLKHSDCGGRREHSRRDMWAHSTVVSPFHPGLHPQHDPKAG